MRHPHRSLSLLTGVVLVLAACGTGGGASASPSSAASPSASPSTSPSASAPASPSASAPASPSGSASGAVTVQTAQSALGTILVDAEGRTLYAFTNDTGGTSSCYEGCEANWPPLTVTGDDIAVGSGLDAAMFSTTERNDGTLQVKIGDWPLYYYAADQAAGDTNGQGVGDIWWVVGTDGELIRS